MEKQCSELFESVFDSHMGGIVRTCVCGITTYSYLDRSCFEWGELEKLEAKHLTDPEHYRPVDHTVGTMMINGEEIVVGCPCDRARKWEAFIRGEAKRLAVYLRRYAEQLRKMADGVDVPSDNVEANKEGQERATTILCKKQLSLCSECADFGSTCPSMRKDTKPERVEGG